MLPTRAAQVVTGSISGRAVDPTDAAVPDANVTLSNEGTSAVLTTTTTDGGAFRFILLPVGNYDLQIRKSGFKTLKMTRVEAQANFENALGDLKLEIGEGSSTVEVTAAPPLIETTTAQVTTVFEGEALKTFPGVQENQGLDFLALQVPGVGNDRDNSFANTNGIGFSVNGLRGRENDQQIDGQNNNDNSVTGPNIFVGNVDFVEEYDITTNNFGPEFGRNAGSVVNEVTKSGTNNWHGTVAGTETNSVLTSLDNFETAEGLTKPPRFNQEFTSGTIGGPIWKDKVFFFGGFDDEINSSNGLVTSQQYLTPTPAGVAELASCFPGSTSVTALENYGPFAIPGGNPMVAAGTTTTTYYDFPPVPNSVDPGPGPTTGDPACGYDVGGVSRILPDGFHEYDWITRMDVHISSADSFFARFLFQKEIYFNQAFTATNQAGGYPVNVPSFSSEWLAAWTHIFSNRLVNEFRLSYGRINVPFGGNTVGNTVPLPGALGSALTSVTFESSALMPFGPPNDAPQSRIVNTYQLQDNLDYTVGRHQLKMGANITLQKSSNIFLPSYNGTFTYADWGSYAASGLPPADPYFVPPVSVSITQGNPTSDFKEWDTFLYFGDDWKVRDNLTLNLGLTWSFYGQPANVLHRVTVAQQTGPDPFWDTSLPLSATTSPELSSVKDLFGPSIGFAWSPGFSWLGGGRTVIRGGYRLTYDPAYYNTFLLAQVSAPVVLSQTLIAPAMGLPAAPFGSAIRSEFAADITPGVFDPRNFDRTVVPNNFGPDRVHEWSLGIQRQVTTNSAVEVRYVGNHGWDLFQSINANPYILGLATSYPALVPPGVTPCTTPLPTVPNAFGTINCSEGVTDETANTGFSNYNALQAQFRATNLAHQLTLVSSYTWSKTLDNVSEIFSTFAAGNTIAYSQNPLNYKGQEYGLSGIDFPHTWTLTFVEDVPFLRAQRGVVGHVLGGWGIAGSYVLQSGQGFTPSQYETNYYTGGVANDTAFDLANIGVPETSRPFVGSMSAPQTQVGIYAADACVITGVGCGDPANELISLNSANATGTDVPVTKSQVRFIANGAEADAIFGMPFGNAGRNSVRDNWTNVGNFELFKNVRVGERVNVQWHMTMNNVFNHPQYGTTSFVGIDPFIEDAGISFADPRVESSANNNCPAGVRCVFFGLKIIY
ncbi:MAG: carboxypeptidase-like regulatory domain-containing protein [Candidatus Acidiferrales bacterium]